MKKKKENVILKVLLSLVIIVLAGLSFTLFYKIKEQDYKEKQKQISVLQDKINKVKLENSEKERRIRYLNTKEGIEEIARNELGFVNGGEVSCVVIDESENVNEHSDKLKLGFWEQMVNNNFY